MNETTLEMSVLFFSQAQPMDCSYYQYFICCHICILNLLYSRNHTCISNTESQQSHISHFPFS